MRKPSNMEGLVNWSRVNWKEELSGLSKEKKEGKREIIKIIVENNKKLLKMQKNNKTLSKEKEGIRKRNERRRKKGERGNK